MSELYDKEGNAIEAFTQEEVEEQKQEIINEAIENYKVEHPENTDVQTLQDELDVAKKDLEAFKETDKGKNMAALRISKEAAEKKIVDLESKITNEIGGLKVLIEAKELKNSINVLADNDIEVAKKIEFQYKRIVKDTDTEEERNKKLGEAYVSVSGGKNLDVLNKVLGSAGAPNKNINAEQSGFSPELVDLGRKFGISAEDIKKFGKK